MARTIKDGTPAALVPHSKPLESKLFRYRGGQAVRIPVAFELPGNHVLIWREGAQLVIKPIANQSRDFRELLSKWRREGPLGPEDELPEILDPPIQPEDPLQ